MMILIMITNPWKPKRATLNGRPKGTTLHLACHKGIELKFEIRTRLDSYGTLTTSLQ